jgi:hypothetical protein
MVTLRHSDFGTCSSAKTYKEKTSEVHKIDFVQLKV